MTLRTGSSSLFTKSEAWFSTERSTSIRSVIKNSSIVNSKLAKLLENDFQS